MRVLTEISQISKGVAARHGIELALTFDPTLPAAPAVLEPGNILGSPPPAITPGKKRILSVRSNIPTSLGILSFALTYCPAHCHAVNAEVFGDFLHCVGA